MGSNQRSCRACGNEHLQIVLDLGVTPLANGLLEPAQLHEREPRFPLTLAFCSECSLVQITETIPPETLFRHYVYFTSFSETALHHAEEIAHRNIRRRRLDERSLVIEVGSNDGYLLQHYLKNGIPVLGIEPATNIAEAARARRGVETINEFFGRNLARRMSARGVKADVIHANNVLAHVPDLNGVVSGIGMILKEDGIAIIEVPYVKDMIDRVEFDTVYHEHLCYFSLTALDQLCSSNHLAITDVERLAIHGGSLRVFIRHGAPSRSRSAAVAGLLHEEQQWGVDRMECYLSFGDAVQRLKRSLLGLLNGLKSRGSRIAAYGASAKGSTLLNCFEIGSDVIDFVVDRSTVKQGLYTPGTHLPIYSPEKLLEAMPDHTLLLTWNFRDEILEQQSEYRKRGGRFIVPLPEPRIM